MDYTQAIQYTHGLLRFGIRPGLARVNALLKACGSPQRGLSAIHVAGTNGKGSVCVMLERMLRSAGYRTGLFISPYVLDFRERIQLCGQWISQADYAALVEALLPAVRKLERAGEETPTEFEFITAAALCYFQKMGCDAVVLETGLGGRLDATNVLDRPLVSVITKIDYDHMAVLGDTIEQIAAEKCGIIKPGVPVVTTAQQDARAMRVIMQTGAQRHAPVFCTRLDDKTVTSAGLSGNHFSYGGARYTLALAGAHQVENAAVALEAVERSGLRVQVEQRIEGLREATIPARLELLSAEPLVLLDGAHNPSGARALAEQLKTLGVPVTMIVGMMADKACTDVLNILAPYCAHMITVEVAGNPRCIGADALAALARGICGNAEAARDYTQALQLAAGRREPIVICGSLYLAGGIRALAKKRFSHS